MEKEGLEEKERSNYGKCLDEQREGLIRADDPICEHHSFLAGIPKNGKPQCMDYCAFLYSNEGLTGVVVRP